jgi:TonB family protein
LLFGYQTADYNICAVRRHRQFYLATLSIFVFLASVPFTAAQDPEQYLREHYLGKTLVLRGLYSANRLRFDSSGTPDDSASGDWTETGFVLLEEIHNSNDQAVIHARRFAAEFVAKEFELRALWEPQPNRKGVRPVIVTIEANFPQHNPSPDQIDALMSKIFLTQRDHLADLVPEYWRGCVNGGATGTYGNCLLSPEILAVPGLSASEGDGSARMSNGAKFDLSDQRQVLRVGKDVSPPRVIYQVDPEFSESARRAKFQGNVTLGLVVSSQGTPTQIHILSPLGSGLDAEAVEAVEKWKFEPAKKNGEPVAVAIAVEVSFHLY